ncbi:mitotic spindle assembly checkpoint protein MAD1 [Trichoderma gamsii]|uniref:Spindle assembly checkpoint component MAD1 n=1 Tax=Trichoderma gamsii TaxID=398673 RepID=A0A2P4ZG83_9HYPO|nr:mitotic spindle assembly checkpoint protein MAD1 [Trichoderma gamsii]PON23282.1 mitotic spindle assembly checkpoint protein MAD1 [Trichoderma gamsii]
MRGRAMQDAGTPTGRPGSRPASRLRAGSTSGLPRPNLSIRDSRIGSFRASTSAHNLTGEHNTSRPSSRQSNATPSLRGSVENLKENAVQPEPDASEKYRKEIEALKAEIGTLQYRLQTAEQEKEIALSQQNNKIEQARRREQEEAQQRQSAESEKAKTDSKMESIRSEMEELKEAVENDKRSLESKLRAAEDETRLLQEQLEDLTSAKDEAARRADKRANDLQMQISAANSSLQDMQQEAEAHETSMRQYQEQILEKDTLIGNLEADVLRLKAQSGDAETMDIIKRELSEQVSHIRALEASNREQLTELKRLRAVNKAVEIVEEEKRSLVRKVEAAERLEAELAEARIQRQRLEDERLSWSAYLERVSETGQAEFDSPEQIARALVQERLTSASYVEQLGAVRAEIAAQQSHTQALEEERAQLRSEFENATTSAQAANVDQVRMRLDRQRALALKEVEYLRAQLKAFDTEEQALQPEQFDGTRVARIQELEDMVDNYKMEVQRLHDELSSMDPLSQQPSSPLLLAGSKRSRAEDDVAQEQMGQLTRKNRKLQEELASVQTQVAMLEKDLSTTREQLSAAKEQAKTRVLSLRSNPTSDYEAIKRATLEALQKENKELLATLRSKETSPSIPLIPTSVLGAMEREIAAAKAETASAQKSARRLKEVWGSKSQEFKEAIFSTLGWTVTFIPNGKMRVESTFYPSQTDEHENSIVFDGERGTMKVGGGPKSAFAQKIGDHIGFWVREKGCIPGFLAALTLEFYEEHARAASGE